jgi:hypothetical protein
MKNIAYATSENPHTDPALTPEKRARQAFESNEPCDYNEETEEYNPYVLDSPDYWTYHNKFMALNDEFTRRYPWA